MSLPTALEDAGLKLERARILAEGLSTEMIDLAKTGAFKIKGDVRAFDEDSSEIRFFASSMPEIPKQWSPILGDIIQNLRNTLDYIWWQAAILELGREPTEKEARGIQFPCVAKKSDWVGHRHLEHVSQDARDIAEKLQPFQAQDETYLELLVRLSNHDKHRRLHLAFLMNVAGSFFVPAKENCIDCRIPTEKNDEGEEVFAMKINWGNGAFQRIGDDGLIFGIEVEKTGDSPDIQLSEAPEFQVQPGITEGDFGLGETIRGLGKFTQNVLGMFVPLFDKSS